MPRTTHPSPARKHRRSETRHQAQRWRRRRERTLASELIMSYEANYGLRPRHSYRNTLLLKIDDPRKSATPQIMSEEEYARFLRWSSEASFRRWHCPQTKLAYARAAIAFIDAYGPGPFHQLSIAELRTLPAALLDALGIEKVMLDKLDDRLIDGRKLQEPYWSLPMSDPCKRRRRRSGWKKDALAALLDWQKQSGDD